MLLLYSEEMLILTLESSLLAALSVQSVTERMKMLIILQKMIYA